MRKKAIVLATACAMILVVVFFEFYVFKTPMRQTTPISTITNNPSAWLNKTVVVEGSLLYNPELIPSQIEQPWNYELSFNGTSIGVLWREGFTGQVGWRDALVLGIVTEGQAIYQTFNGNFTKAGPLLYFIEAEEIEIL